MSTTEGIGGCLSASAAAPATFDAVGYAALTWTDIEETREIPDFGPEHSTVTHTPLKTGIVNKYHGELNYGSITLPMARFEGAVGQAILEAALASRDEISFRETRSDGSLRYFSGKVMSFTSGQSISAVVPATAMIEITRATIPVAA